MAGWLKRGCAPLQYNFTVVEAGCTASCTELVFTSSTKDVALTGLSPSTTVHGEGAAAGCRRGCVTFLRCPPACLPCSQAHASCTAQYNVTVIGVDGSGSMTAGTGVAQFTTPAAPPPPAPFALPFINGSTPTNSTAGVVDITPPSTQLNCTAYIVQLCNNGTCFNTTCPSRCPVTGLSPGTTYTVSAVCVDAVYGEVPASNTGTLTTPPSLALTSASATSPTSGTATATPSANNPFTSVRLAGLQSRTARGLPPLASRACRPCVAVCCWPCLQYNFTVVEAGCTASCTVIVISSNSSTASLPGLEPGTKYNVTVVGIDANGTATPGDGVRQFTTPPTLSITSASATSPWSGNATATPSASNPFVSVRGRAGCGHAQHRGTPACACV